MQSNNAPNKDTTDTGNRLYLYLIGLFAINILFFVYLEIRHPYYFLNDDNRTLFLPNFIHNYKCIAQGSFPFFNFHQYLGIPHFSTPMAAAFYPPVYLATALSRFSVGHYFAAIDILVIMHLIAGGVGFFYVMKIMKMPLWCAFWGALVWEFNGFSLYVSNSWWVISCAGAFLPWLIYYGLIFFENPRNLHLVGLSVLRAVYFYSGYPQYFVYSCIFELFFLLSFVLPGRDKLWKRKWITYLFSYIITGVLILPLLLPIRYHTQMSSKTEALHYNVFNATSYKIKPLVQGLINPYRPNIKGVDKEWEKKYQLSFFGYIAQAMAFIGLLYLLWDRKQKYRRLYGAALVNGILAFLLTTGLINRLVYCLPVLNRFTAPFKYMLYLDFYASMLAVLGFYVLFEIRLTGICSKRIIKQVFASGMILCQVLNMLLLISLLPVRSFNFRPHLDPLPVKEPFARQISDARLVTLGANINDPYTIKSLGFNYATIWGLYQVSGFDPMVPVRNFSHVIEPGTPLRDKVEKYMSFIQFASFNDDQIPFSDFRMWGVKWYVIPKNKKDLQIDADYAGLLAGRNLTIKDRPETYAYLESNQLIPAFEDESRKIYQDPLAKPLVYWFDLNNNQGIEFHINPRSIAISTQSPEDRVLVINFIYHPFFKAILDQSQDLKILTLSPFDQMALHIPAGKHTIRLRYSDPYLIIGITTCILLIALYLLIVKYVQVRKKNLQKKQYG